jgi:hypothetical protein
VPSFSPLAGIKLLERFVEAIADYGDYLGFSPLAGIKLLESWGMRDGEINAVTIELSRF